MKKIATIIWLIVLPVALALAVGKPVKPHAPPTYTIVLYGSESELGRWQTKAFSAISSSMGGVEFTDLSSGHRMRINGTFTIESTTGDPIVEDGGEDQDTDSE